MFVLALFDFLHGAEPMEIRFTKWVEAIGRLPRIKTRVLTWPLSCGCRVRTSIRD